jgi:hypothetical protein
LVCGDFAMAASRVTIDLVDGDGDSELEEGEVPPPQEDWRARQKRKRDMASSRPNSGEDERQQHAEDAEDDEQDAVFSEGEDDVPLPTPIPLWGTDGYDFSGVVCADAEQRYCPLCGRTFQLAWDSTRQTLVIKEATMVSHETFHTACVAKRRGPSTVPFNRIRVAPRQRVT